MLHMVLFLLKIIGILIGVILGLLLILILVVLLVPIRYRIWADNREDIQGRVKVTWLLRIISFQITYVNEKLSIKLKIFGRIFFDNNNPRKAGKGPIFKKNTQNKKSKKKGSSNLDRKLKKQVLQKNAVNEVIETKENEFITKNNVSVSNNAEDISLENKNLEDKRLEDKSEQKILPEVPQDESTLSQSPSLKVEEGIEISDDLIEPIEKEKEKGFFQKIKNFFLKIKGSVQKIKLGLDKFKNLFHTLGESISNITNKWDKIKSFYKSNKLGIKQSFYAVKKIVKHVLPRKIKGQIEFGTGDPCSTGQALGVVAAFYGIYGKYVQITPNFNELIIEGNIYIYGRIRIVTLLIIGVKLILNKNFKELIKNFRALKEDL